MSASLPPEPVNAPSGADSLRLYNAGLGGLVLIAAWFIFKSGGDLTLRTLFGLATLILASVPALRWAKLRRTWFPVFEIACLIYIAFYAIPLLAGHSELTPYPDEVVAESGLLIVLFLGMANIGFETLRHPARPPRWAVSSLLPEEFTRYIPLGQTLNSAYIYVFTFTDLIPSNVSGTLRALFFGIGTLSTFMLARQAGLGVISPRDRALFIANLTIQVVFLFAQLYLIGGISLLALSLIAYASARRRIPWAACAVILPAVALLHMGKPAMRAIYWQNGEPLPGLVELPGFFTRWVDLSVRELGVMGTAEQIAPSNLFERASLIQMLCLSVDRIPSLKPHLNGETYLDVPAQIVPRFLWPGKPSGLYSNVRLALYFNLVSIESALNVSIAFGMVAEAYANFGHVGVLVLGFLMGAIARRLSAMAESAAMFSALGILMILLSAWSFQIELVMATWMGSLMQAMVVCIGLPLIYRRLTQV